MILYKEPVRKTDEELLYATGKHFDELYRVILTLAGVPNGEVKQTKCMKRGDYVCEFDITW